MKIIRCVPLPGQGLVARFGDLVAVSDGLGAGQDPLFGAVQRVSAAAGDGGALVRAAARAALESDGQRACACAGLTSTDELVVLVSGDAMVTVVVDGGQPVTLSGSSSLIPVSQIFTGAVINATIALAESAAELPAADARFRLDDGVVPGVGLAITVTSRAEHADPDPAAADPEAPELGAPELGAPEPVTTRLDIPLRGQRATAEFQPPVGVLVLDDGTAFALDADYVIGREPALDTDVAAGRARPLRIADPEGTVSRLHLRVAVIGGQVAVSDLGSGNGSMLHPSAGRPHRLVPNEPKVIEPGARITFGDRSFEYLSRAALTPGEG
jgi:hypothetical protein